MAEPVHLAQRKIYSHIVHFLPQIVISLSVALVEINLEENVGSTVDHLGCICLHDNAHDLNTHKFIP